MKTNTRSTHYPSLLSLAPYDEVGDLDRSVDQAHDWPAVHRTRHELMSVVDRFAETPSGRRLLLSWSAHELLIDALELIAEGPRVDALLLRSRDLAAAFGTDLFETLSLGECGRVLLPDLVAAFVPYAHALLGLPAHDTAVSLSVIDGCRAAFVDPFMSQPATRFDSWRRSVDRWRPPPPPTPYELLVGEVGSQEALAALTVDPLPTDEDVDLRAVCDDVRDRLREALDLADPVVTRVLGAEHRTAVRRLLVDAVTSDPEILRRKGRTLTLTAGACLAVARADHQLTPHGPMKSSMLAEHFGLTGMPTSRETTLVKAVAGSAGFGRAQPLPPRYLTGRRRTELVRRRDELATTEPVRQAS